MYPQVVMASTATVAIARRRPAGSVPRILPTTPEATARGSLLVYSADVAHRGTEMTTPAGGRFFFNLAYKGANADWLGANPWPRKGMTNWTQLVEACSVRQLEALGWPPPGHPYWDAETLAGTAQRYPGLDLAPWRAALETDP